MTIIKNFDLVASGIYRGGLISNENFHLLKEFGIRSIISMKTNKSENEMESKLAAESGINYKNRPINLLLITNEAIINFYNVIRLIELLPKPIFVHCTHGSDRTGMAIAMYRILENQYTLLRSIDEMDRFGFNPIFNCWKEFLVDFYEVNSVYH